MSVSEDLGPGDPKLPPPASLFIPRRGRRRCYIAEQKGNFEIQDYVIPVHFNLSWVGQKGIIPIFSWCPKANTDIRFSLVMQLQIRSSLGRSS